MEARGRWKEREKIVSKGKACNTDYTCAFGFKIKVMDTKNFSYCT
jgi:hypothetical protein